MPAKPLMIQGTGSFVGKSMITAGLCRVLRQDGYRVAPFKAQNMALNSFVTPQGGEMGRAQVVQAEAAGLEPHVDMNPVLLKPHTDTGVQVILQGKVFGNMEAAPYHRFKKEALRAVRESYRRLSEKYQAVVIEGAGSPAEVNLREGDIVNMGMAEVADAPVLLVGDIDKGGVFASLVGTLELLSPEDRGRVRGFIINKFRGDLGLLLPGLEFLERKTGVPVLGVVPFLRDLHIPEEDGVVPDRPPGRRGGRALEIAVLYLPHISNFTDFDPLEHEAGICLRYVHPGQKIGEADAVILPGSKNTLEDFLFLEGEGYAREILDLHRSGRPIIGICGGFQMLGKVIRDPHGVESGRGEVRGLGLLDVATTLLKEKQTFQVSAVCLEGPGSESEKGETLGGYEIHMGETVRGPSTPPAFRIVSRLGREVRIDDGAIASGGRVWGTYIHGLFENDGFRGRFIESLRREKGPGAEGVDPAPFHSARPPALADYRAFKEGEYDKLASALRSALDVPRIYRIAGID